MFRLTTEGATRASDSPDHRIHPRHRVPGASDAREVHLSCHVTPDAPRGLNTLPSAAFALTKSPVRTKGNRAMCSLCHPSTHVICFEAGSPSAKK